MTDIPKFTPVSAAYENWQFKEASPIPARYFSERFDGYELEGRVLPASENSEEMPRLLAVHGARSDYTKLNPVLYQLQVSGISSLSFNLSGHNESSGIRLRETSLGKNLQEALRFADRLGEKFYAVSGHSMGGTIALKIAEAHRESVKKIVLFCPAIYSDDAYEANFGEPFKEAISIPFGFLNSRSLAFLREFSGEVMLIIGQYDGLKSTDFGGIAGKSAGVVTVKDGQPWERIVNSAIPFEVVGAIEESVLPQKLHKIVLPDCDHAISSWLRADPSRSQWLSGQVADFLDMPVA